MHPGFGLGETTRQAVKKQQHERGEGKKKEEWRGETWINKSRLTHN